MPGTEEALINVAFITALAGWDPEGSGAPGTEEAIVGGEWGREPPWGGQGESSPP